VRIALVLNDDFSMWQFRKGLIIELRRAGHEVFVYTPAGPWVKRMETLGAIHRTIPIFRFVSPLQDLALVWVLRHWFSKDRVDLVHNMTVKPTIYGAFAARLAGVRRVVALVSGIGLPFLQGGGMRRRALRATVIALYRVALRLTDRVWFQNGDDLRFFVGSSLLEEHKAVLIRSSGVDVTEFSEAAVDKRVAHELRQALQIDADRRCVVMIVARLIWSKGVREFVEAAEILRQRSSGARLLLVGPYDPGHPDEISPGYLEARAADNFRAITAFRTDVREILSLADLVVLPSFFGEGVPRVLLEAAAMSKPIVTTDNPGCREVVEHNHNGFLVPVKNPEALAAAIAQLSADAAMRREFGRRSRAKVEAEFDERLVVNRILQELYGFGESLSAWTDVTGSTSSIVAGRRRAAGRAKRCFDLALAGLGCLLLSPLLIAVALAVKLGDGHSVFHRGVRVGLHGVPFRLFKYRTMVVGAQSLGGSSTPDDDPRITRVGRVLRRYKLDELPQLFNVLRGEMSLVGPRPQVAWAVEHYTDHERALLDVLPGMTDYASILFHDEGALLRGADDPDRAYLERIAPEKIRLGLDYVLHRSLWTDTKILLATLGVVVGLDAKRCLDFVRGTAR
jgi:lipopolysaccharide/colanic/teichoic acid biosynthesis glycosyltransferase/glycosyltransferase involved in cell wall biosynthesis